MGCLTCGAYKALISSAGGSASTPCDNAHKQSIGTLVFNYLVVPGGIVACTACGGVGYADYYVSGCGCFGFSGGGYSGCMGVGGSSIGCSSIGCGGTCVVPGGKFCGYVNPYSICDPLLVIACVFTPSQVRKSICHSSWGCFTAGAAYYSGNQFTAVRLLSPGWQALVNTVQPSLSDLKSITCEPTLKPMPVPPWKPPEGLQQTCDEHNKKFPNGVQDSDFYSYDHKDGDPNAPMECKCKSPDGWSPEGQKACEELAKPHPNPSCEVACTWGSKGATTFERTTLCDRVQFDCNPDEEDEGDEGDEGEGGGSNRPDYVIDEEARKLCEDRCKDAAGFTVDWGDDNESDSNGNETPEQTQGWSIDCTALKDCNASTADNLCISELDSIARAAQKLQNLPVGGGSCGCGGMVGEGWDANHFSVKGTYMLGNPSGGKCNKCEESMVVYQSVPPQTSRHKCGHTMSSW